jgi:glycosyltransferase involved in cell wall biosynthesis
LACGTPVVTYRTGGSPESITDETGVLVDKGNVEALAEAIIKMRSGATNITREACRKHAVENHNQLTRFREYIELYESLLAK